MMCQHLGASPNSRAACQGRQCYGFKGARCTVGVHAVSRYAGPSVGPMLRARGKLGSRPCEYLFDTGANQSFVSLAFCKANNIKVTPSPLRHASGQDQGPKPRRREVR